jgi:hypothetical protein
MMVHKPMVPAPTTTTFCPAGSRLFHRVHAHRQRLDQCPGFCWKVRRQLVQQIRRHVDQFGEGTIVHQSGEGQVLADVVQAVGAVVAGAAMLAGIGRHRFADAETLTPAPSSTISPQNS